MNLKAYSVLFCALFASTFVHELRAKGVAPVSSRLGVFERAASNEVCELKCSFNGSVSLPSFNLTIQVVKDIFIAANLTGNVAFLLDVSAQIVVLLDGSSGGGLIFDLAAQAGVYIKSGLWVAASGSLEVWIKSLSGGLKGLLTFSGAISFKFSSITNEIQSVLNSIVVKLVFNISLELQQNAKLGFQLLLAISGGLIVLFKGSLNGLFALIASGAITISADLAGLLNILQGFAAVIVKISGSLSAAIEAGLVIDLSLILGARNGLEALINFVLAIGANSTLSAKLVLLFADAQAFFALVAQLGGSSHIGISGIFTVVSHIFGFINKNVTLEFLIGSVIQFVAESSTVVQADLSGALNATLSGFLLALERVNLSGQLSAVVTVVKALIAGNLIVAGVSVSAIVTQLLVVSIGVRNLLHVVVAIVLELRAVAAFATSIPYLLLVLIFKINSAIGVSQLIALGIGISVNVGAAAGGILHSILSGSLSLIFNLLTGQFYNVLIKLPVIGVIVQSLNAAISASSNGQISLKALLDVNSLVKNLLLAFFQVVTGFKLGASSSHESSAKAIFESTSSASASLNVNLTLAGSGSFSGSGSGSFFGSGSFGSG